MSLPPLSANHLLLTMLRWLIAGVWLVNGLYCKVLNAVPRHQQIVAAILGADHARLLTVLIGLSEIIMAIWIVSGYQQRLNVILQLLVIAIMNTIEFLLVPHLLLWGSFNAFFALLLCIVIYMHAVASGIFKTQPV